MKKIMGMLLCAAMLASLALPGCFSLTVTAETEEEICGDNWIYSAMSWTGFPFQDDFESGCSGDPGKYKNEVTPSGGIRLSMEKHDPKYQAGALAFSTKHRCSLDGLEVKMSFDGFETAQFNASHISLVWCSQRLGYAVEGYYNDFADCCYVFPEVNDYRSIESSGMRFTVPKGSRGLVIDLEKDFSKKVTDKTSIPAVNVICFDGYDDEKFVQFRGKTWTFSERKEGAITQPAETVDISDGLTFRIERDDELGYKIYLIEGNGTVHEYFDADKVAYFPKDNINDDYDQRREIDLGGLVGEKGFITAALYSTYDGYLGTPVLESINGEPAYSFEGDGDKDLAGENIDWTFDEATGTITFEGTGDMYDFGSVKQVPWIIYAGKIKKAVFSEGITSVSAHAFDGHGMLETVVFPESLKRIGDFAFSSCSSLAEPVFPEGLGSLGVSCFEGCGSFKEIIIPDGVSSIGGSCFKSCKSLESVKLPASLGSVEQSVFFECERLTGIIIPENVSSIGDSAFAGCKHLVQVNIPGNVRSIGEWAFGSCKSLKEVVLPEGLTELSQYAFAYCISLERVVLPHSLKTIDEGAFLVCTAMKSVVIPVSVNVIESYAFSSCDALTDVYYTGYEYQWKKIRTGNYNEPLADAVMHFDTDPNIINKFADIEDEQWYTGAVLWCYRNGYMIGTDKGVFAPFETVTRGMFMQTLARIAGADLDSYEYKGEFKDVSADDWYAEAVEWAFENGYTSGRGDGYFAPNSPVTLEEAAVFFRAYSAGAGHDVSARADLSGYSDAGSISSWALEAVKWAVAEDLVTGTSVSELSPRQITTRARIAVIFRNYVEVYKAKQ